MINLRPFIIQSVIVSIAFFYFLQTAPAQSVKGQVYFSEEYVQTSMQEIIEYEKMNPPDTTPRWKEPKPEWIYPAFPVDESKIIYKHEDIYEPGTMSPLMDPSPLPDDDFMGLGDNNSSIPPDVNGAVGPDHLMITLNTQVRVQGKAGSNLSTVTLGSFWSGLPGASQSFDPKILFDPYFERWIMVCPSGSSNSTSRLLIAASETADPTGNWNMWSLDSDPANSAWFDYPSFGFNKRWVVVSGNMFSGGSFQNNVFFVIKKSDMYSGTPNVQYTRLTYNPSFTIVPAITYDTATGDMHLISNVGGNSASGNIAKYIITGPTGNETFTFEGYISTNNGWTNQSGGTGDFSPQLGTAQKINAGDARIQNVIYRNGKLWATHHVFLPADNPNRTAVQWWELDVDGTVLQFGRVDDPTAEYHFTFPTIAVNALEEILIGYSSFSNGQYASSSYSFRTADDPANTLRDRYQFKDGKASYYKTFGGGRNRWGDYSATHVDPNNDLNFWTLQEYAELPSGGWDRWGCWWAHLIRETDPVAGFAADITTVPVGESVNFFDESLYLPTSWEWTFEGGSPSSSTQQNPQDIVYSQAGQFDVTLIVSNNMGTDTLVVEDYITASSTILPEVDFLASDTVPCTDQIVTLIDLTIYSPIAWNWEITPGGFSFINGTSASSQFPEVVFNSPGYYSVTLTAENANGSSSATKNDFILAGGNPMPYSESFEIPFVEEAGWTVDNPDNDITWDLAAVGGNNPGSTAAWVNLRDYATFGERDMLISPPLNFAGYVSVEMTFQHAYAQRFPTSADSLIIHVSEDCGVSWEEVFWATENSTGAFATHSMTNNDFTPQIEEDWCGSGFGTDCFSVDLDDYAGKSNVRILFEIVNGFGNNFYLDNLNFTVITGLPGTVAQELLFDVFPNPADKELTISLTGANAKYEFISPAGRKVVEGQIMGGNGRVSEKIDLSGLSEGLYLLRVSDETRSSVRKIVVK